MSEQQSKESSVISAHSSPSRSRHQWKECLGVALIGGLCHAVLIFALGVFTRGADFSDDIGFFLHFAQEPMQILTGTGDIYPMFPPLMPLALSIFYKPYSIFFEDFYAIRLVSVTFETMALFVIWLSVFDRIVDAKKRLFLAVCLIASPVGWMSTSLFSQDESISMLFMALTVFCIMRGRLASAAFVSGLGIICAKVYFLVPFVGICAIVSTNSSLLRGIRVCLIGALPCVSIYLLQAYFRHVNGFSGDTFASFAPRLENSINIWALVDYFHSVDPHVAKRVSGILALCCSMYVPVRRFFRGESYSEKQMIALLCGMLTWVYASFYHVNPEYFIIIAPCLIFILEAKWFAVVYVVGLSVPWATNIFFGINNAIASGVDVGAKAKLAAIYSTLFPIPASIMFLVSLGLGALILFVLAIHLSSRFVCERD